MKRSEEKLAAQRIVFPEADYKIICERRRFCENDRAFHEEIEIKYYLSGSSALMIDGEVLIASKGALTVVNPFELHSNLNFSGYEGEYILLMVGLDFLKEFSPGGLDLRQMLISKGKRLTHYINEDKRLATIMIRIAEELSEEKDNYRLVVYSLITELFVLLFREYTRKELSAEELPASGKAAGLIAPALSAIFENYSKQMSLDELASLCNISKYHFSRVFKEEMKMTVVEYITSYRISLADVMLKDGDKSIEEIARECGFSDISYFYRCYKRLKGTSPKRARLK